MTCAEKTCPRSEYAPYILSDAPTRTIEEQQRIALQYDGFAKAEARRLADKFAAVEYDDALQECRIRLFVAAGLVETDNPDHARNFMWFASRQAATDYARRASRRGITRFPRGTYPAVVHSELSMIADESAPTEAIDTAEIADRIKTAARRLPHKLRRAFTMRFLEGATIDRVADAIGWPRSTTQKRCRTAAEIVQRLAGI